MILRTFWVVALALLDFSVAVVAQIFWGNDYFVCEEGGGESETVVTLLGLILGCHLLYVGSRMARLDANGNRVGLKYLYNKQVHNGWKGLAYNLYYIATLLVSAGLLAVQALGCRGEGPGWGRELERLHLVVHLTRVANAVHRCFGLKEEVRRRLRTTISVNKRRFIDVDGNFDLDLTYICDRLVAMALPTVTGANVMYRNDVREVARFFAARHYGAFLVFNLCEAHEQNGNGNYDCSLLYGQVQKLPFKDHNAPPLQMLVSFCEQATEWLNEHSSHVVAVHCQGGKGRTGTFCAALLLWTGFAQTAAQALDAYARRRTDLRRGGRELQRVCAPSQIRYVHYLEAVVYCGVDVASPPPLVLTGVVVRHLALPRKAALTLLVEMGGEVYYDHAKDFGLSHPPRSAEAFTLYLPPLVVCGDVAVRLYAVDTDELEEPTDLAAADLLPGATQVRYEKAVGKEVCFVTLHTAFHEPGVLAFSKCEVDGAYNQTDAKVPAGFSLELHLHRPSDVQLSPDHPLPAPERPRSPAPATPRRLSASNPPPPPHSPPTQPQGEAIPAGVPLLPSAGPGKAPRLPTLLLHGAWPLPRHDSRDRLLRSAALSSDSRRSLEAGKAAAAKRASLEDRPDTAPAPAAEWARDPLAGLALVRLRAEVAELMGRAGQRRRRFHAGDVILDAMRPPTATLCFLLRGSAVHAAGSNRGAHKRKNPVRSGNSVEGMTVGEGRFVGELPFLLGFDAEAAFTSLLAASDTHSAGNATAGEHGASHVQCSDSSAGSGGHTRHCVFSGGTAAARGVCSVSADCLWVEVLFLECGSTSPVSVSGLAEQEVAKLYQLLAADLAAAVAAVERHIQHLSAMERMKRDRQIHNAQALKTRLAHKMLEKFHIPLDKTIETMSTCTVLSGESSGAKGQLLVFSDCVIFHAGKVLFKGPRKARDLQLAMRRVVRVEAAGKTLSLLVNITHDPPDPRPASHASDSEEGPASPAARRIRRRHTESGSGLEEGEGEEGWGELHRERHKSKSEKRYMTALDEAGERSALQFQMQDEMAALDARNAIAYRLSKRDKHLTLGSVVTEDRTRLRGNLGCFLDGESVPHHHRAAVEGLMAGLEGGEKRRVFEDQQVLMRVGDTTRHLLFVLSGCVFIQSREGKLHGRVSAGEVLGEGLVFEGGNRGSVLEAVAAGQVECLALSRADIASAAWDPHCLRARLYRSLAVFGAAKLKRRLKALDSRSKTQLAANSAPFVN